MDIGGVDLYMTNYTSVTDNGSARSRNVATFEND
jgi:hypothetical protein